MENILLLGLDLGTSSTKAILSRTDGTILAEAAKEYGILSPRQGWAEQDPGTWQKAAWESIRQALELSGASPVNIVAIGLSGQMHGTVCLDHQGQVLRPAIIWADQRSARQVEEIYRTIGKERLGGWTGNPLATGFMLATLSWLRENEPEIARETQTLLLPKDFLRYRMTGELGSEPSDASSTLLFDPFHVNWSWELLKELQIDPGLLPSIYPSSQIAGTLGREWSKATGLLEGTPVVFGGSDQALQALGNGVVQPGTVSCTIGTGGQLLAPSLEPAFDPQLRLHLFCHAAPNLWHLEAATLSAGLSLKWLRDQMFEGYDYTQLADLASQAPPGSGGLLFHPYLVGERTPLMDPNRRASFSGLSLHHKRSHLVRAVMEGVVLSLRQGLDLILELGIPCEQIVASGGGTRNALWLELMADIFNRPISQTESREAAALGAALLAGVGVGVYSDLRSAVQQAVHWKDIVIQPDPQKVEIYRKVYEHYIAELS